MDAGPLSPTEFASAVTAITSAFGDPTRRDIYLFVRGEALGVTASQVADAFALHPNVARHHLDKLASGGYVERVTEKDMTLEFPVRHDDLLVTLLGRALAQLPRERAEAMAEEVGIEYGRAMAASVAG